MKHPNAYELVLLSLAAWRVYRLIAVDEITARIRGRVTLPDDVYEAWADHIDNVAADGGDVFTGDLAGWVLTYETDTPVQSEIPTFSRRRFGVARFIRCPWCMGWWIGVAVWGMWLAAEGVTLCLAAPFAISALVGLVQRNLDRED